MGVRGVRSSGGCVAGACLAGWILALPAVARAQSAGTNPPCSAGCGREMRDTRGCCDAPRTPPTPAPSAPPCTLAQLRFDVDTEGAAGSLFGVLRTRNASDAACTLDGAPDVRFVDRANRTIQSADRTHQPDATPPVILAPGAWAHAALGRIASNVCGGDRSDFVVVTWDHARHRFAFRNGGPVHRGQCSGAALRAVVRPHPGQLRVERFAAYD